MGIDDINELKPDPVDLDDHDRARVFERFKPPQKEVHHESVVEQYLKMKFEEPLVMGIPVNVKRVLNINNRIVVALAGIGWTEESALTAIEAMRQDGIVFLLLDRPEEGSGENAGNDQPPAAS